MPIAYARLGEGDKRTYAADDAKTGKSIIIGTPDAPGNVLIPAADSGLAKDSVANVSQIVTLDKSQLTQRVSKLPPRYMRAVNEGLRVVLLP